MHHAFVVDAEGEKLSKSLGNFTNLLDLVDTMDPRSYRMLLLQSHYRSPVQANTETVGAAERALAGLDTFVRRAAAAGCDGRRWPTRSWSPRSALGWTTTSTPPARWRIVFDAARRGNAAIDAGDLAMAATLAATVTELCGAVGLVLKTGDDEIPADVLAQAGALDAARAGEGLRRGRRDPGGAAGGRLGRRDDQAGDERAATVNRWERDERTPLPKGFATVWTTVGGSGRSI